jgi:prephenate dehydrogenase
MYSDTRGARRWIENAAELLISATGSTTSVDATTAASDWPSSADLSHDTQCDAAAAATTAATITFATPSDGTPTIVAAIASSNDNATTADAASSGAANPKP